MAAIKTTIEQTRGPWMALKEQTVQEPRSKLQHVLCRILSWTVIIMWTLMKTSVSSVGKYAKLFISQFLTMGKSWAISNCRHTRHTLSNWCFLNQANQVSRTSKYLRVKAIVKIPKERQTFQASAGWRCPTRRACWEPDGDCANGLLLTVTPSPQASAGHFTGK